MANVKISELNELTEKENDDYLAIVDTSASETKKISVENLTASGVQLIAVTDTAPEEGTYQTGDKYYNTTDNKIYTATSNDWTNPQTPIENIFYIILETQNIYTYDDENETLVSVGGGAGGGETLPVGTQVDFVGSTSDIPTGWEQITDGAGAITTGTINNSTTVANNTIEIAGSISLTPGTYIIEGTLNLFSTTGTRWINLAIGTNAFAQAYIEGVYGGSVIGIIHLDNNATVNLQIANYTGSTLTYTPHSSDKLVAVKISN